ncbi:MAG: hypothetical protein ACRD0P_00670 [Stackebrandtia sp.]
MNPITRRIAAVALGGVLAVGSLSGCGIFGSALDCGKLAQAANDAGTNAGDPDALKTSIDELNKAAEGVDDSELKSAVEDLTAELEKATSDNPDEVLSMDQGKVDDSLATIQEKCG